MKWSKSLPLMFVLFLLFIWLGRSIYMPLWYKIKGKESIQQVVGKLEDVVQKRLESRLRLAGFEDFPKEILMVGLKEERILEVYGVENNINKLITKYSFTATSGKLGPKLKEGDRQIPEGIYKVEYLNPNSSYHLSLKVSYPNEFDKKKTQLDNVSEMGGDIFIHGKAVTIGCIPIGDESIEEVFVMAQNALNNPIKVIISPRDFRVNDDYPMIESIDWENELYSIIKEELKKISMNK